MGDLEKLVIVNSLLVLIMFILFVAALLVLYREREKKKEAIDAVHTVRDELRTAKGQIELYKEKEVDELKIASSKTSEQIADLRIEIAVINEKLKHTNP